jgi:membrane associated rhomboid family serine protease
MAFGQLVGALHETISAFKYNAHFVGMWLLALWIIMAVNVVMRYRLNVLGIYPRSIQGLFGIFFAPFLHYDFNHLFFNSIPLFVLANLILTHGRENFYCISLIIIIVSGLGIWLFGKKGIYIGASGLIMGYFGYLLASVYLHFTAMGLILAILALYYFGGLFLALFPSSRKNVSWLGHVLGFVAGFAAVYLCPIIQSIH